ncbi:MAG: DUF4446 family protein [Armatimonadota bacterium]
MNWIDTLFELVQEHGTLIILVLSALVLCLLIFSLYVSIKLGRLFKSGDSSAAATGLPVDNMEELAKRLIGAEGEIAQLQSRQASMIVQLDGSLQNVGLVRFDAFPDVGGGQSFALALLDQNKNGVVISSLYGRTDSRIYAKEIIGGRSSHTLSDEEIDAVRQAKSSQG